MGVSARAPKPQNTSSPRRQRRLSRKKWGLDLEYKFRELSCPQQSDFSMHLHCNVKNRYMEVAKVDFDRLPGEAIEWMFQDPRDNDLMDTERRGKAGDGSVLLKVYEVITEMPWESEWKGN
ncbi:hypothetical protein ACJ73_03341 [Blastomyces percursus]|uniref:Uncharacterized protein n=1 Tax=Blastomyces percursus TaxID=1658174 RepID=A0A1J9RCB4_9EURO|nr:hypothetical protein ACJ73_03341 [Blastomyces percursus]